MGMPQAMRFVRKITERLPDPEFPPMHIEYDSRHLTNLGLSRKDDLKSICSAQAEETQTFVYTDQYGNMFDVLLTRQANDGTVFMVAIATRPRPEAGRTA